MDGNRQGPARCCAFARGPSFGSGQPFRQAAGRRLTLNGPCGSWPVERRASHHILQFISACVSYSRIHCTRSDYGLNFATTVKNKTTTAPQTFTPSYLQLCWHNSFGRTNKHVHTYVEELQKILSYYHNNPYAILNIAQSVLRASVAGTPMT